jgi:hypothetical protein
MSTYLFFQTLYTTLHHDFHAEKAHNSDSGAICQIIFRHFSDVNDTVLLVTVYGI